MVGKRALALAIVSTALAALHSALTPMAWVDSAHVAMRYARRISDHGTVTLLGQAEPVEAFANPLWTAFLAVLGALQVHELKVQPFLGPTLFALVVGVSVLWVARARPSLGGGVFTALLAASPVLALAARSGSDDLLVAFLMVSSAWGCALAARWAVLPLFGLALCGVLPLVVAGGLAAVHSRRALAWVGGAIVVLTLMRMAIFGTLIPHAGIRLLQNMSPSTLVDAAQLIPVSLGLAIVGLGMLVRAGESVWPFAWAVGVSVLGAILQVSDAQGFAAVLVPVMPLLVVAASLGLSRAPRAGVLLGIAGIAMLGGDVRLGFGAQDDVIKAREAERRQARAMSKFLRWRFADGATVVVQTPGMLPYFLRMPTVDLQGLSHAGPTDQAAMQALDPEVMIPLGKIVSGQPVRLSMAADWDWKGLAETHVQHAIMQSRDWEVVPVHPTWFNLYMRESLPKYPPKWMDIYAREEAARAEQKKRAEDEASSR